MDKKAFEIQFNWMFVLVAGAAILLFFTMIVVKQKSVSETSTKATVLKGVEALISGASATIDTTKQESIPDSYIEIGCGRVSVGGVSRQYQSLVLFAPESIKGNKLIWQTMALSMPYRASNLLYMTTPHIRYILIGSNNLAKEVNKSLPPSLKKEFYESMPITIRNQNNHKVKFIVFGNINLDSIDLSNLQNMQASDVTAIKINGDIEKGFIQFYEKSDDAWTMLGTSAYAGKSSLVGAVYADTLEAYQCNMKNAFSRSKLVSEIYIGRTEKLLLSTTIPKCIVAYNNALSLLKKLNTTSYTLSKLSSSFNEAAMIEISNSAKLLSEENEALQKFSCPLIY